MKRFFAVLIALTMFIEMLPINGAAASNVLYDIDKYGEFPSVVRLDGGEVFGIGGCSADDSCGKFQLNTEEKNGQYNGYFDLSWGKVTSGIWDKADYSGYLVTKFSVYTDATPEHIGLYTDGNSDVSSNLKDKIRLDKWNDVMVVTDRTGGANHGKTATYVNEALVIDWYEDKLGQPHGISSFKYHLRFLMGGAQGSVFYMDDVCVYETDILPIFGDVVTPVVSSVSELGSVRLSAESYSGSKFGRENISCFSITDSDSASDAFFQKDWKPQNTLSAYFVLSMNIAPDEKVEKMFIGTNQHNPMSATAYNGVHLTKDRWNSYIMVYDIINNTSDVYINGEKIFAGTAGKYVVGTSNCFRIIFAGDGFGAYIDNLNVYECIDYPEISDAFYAEDCFNAEIGVHIDNQSGAISTMGDKTVATVKAVFPAEVDVRVYQDDTYSYILNDDDVIAKGGVVVAETVDNILTYYSAGVYEKDALSFYSENYNENCNILVNDSINIIAPVSDGGVLAIAQYNENGELLKLRLTSDKGETCINDVFVPEAVDNSIIKSFLWKDNGNIKPISENAEIEYTTGKTVCFLGDSITQKGKYIEEVYEYYCKDDSAKPGLRMFNCGIPGDKTSDALVRIDEDCLSYNPDVTFVMLGTNDMNINYFPLDSAKFAANEANRNAAYDKYKDNMTAIIERILEFGSEVILIAPVPYDDVSDGTTQRNVGIEKCSEIVKKLAEKYKLDYIDMYEGMKDLKWSDYYYSDMVHPSERGHHVMAQIILRHYGCVDEVDTGDYIRSFTTANAIRYEQSYHYRFVKHIDYSAGFKGLTLAEKKSKALATINSAASSHDKMRYTLYYDNVETIDKMNEELIRLTIETSLKR